MKQYMRALVEKMGKLNLFLYTFLLAAGYCLYSILPYTLPKIFDKDYGLHLNWFFAIVSFISFIIVPVLNYPYNFAMQNIRKYSKQVLFENLTQKKYTYFNDMDTGKIQDLFSEASFCVRNLLQSGVQFVIRHSAIIIINSIAFFSYNLFLGLTYILSYSLYFCVSIMLLKKKNDKIRSTLLSTSDATSYLIDYCQNLDSIYSFRSFQKEKEIYRTYLDVERKSYYSLQFSIDNAKLIQHIVLICITFLQLVVFSLGTSIEMDNISFYLGLVYSIFNLRDFGGEYLSMAEMLSRLKSALKLLKYNEDYKKGNFRFFSNDCTDAAISLSKVNLVLDGRKILNSVNLTVNKGEHIMVCGENGSGKSTLLKVMAAILDIDSGQVKYGFPSPDGIIYISQNTNLFNRTIYENIIYPRSSANEAQVRELIKQFELSSLIADDSDLFEKKPGDFGNKFSGGEKQKILIIRALINSPNIVLFDEITSSLDMRSTKKFFEIVGTKLKNSTVLCVSHNNGDVNVFDRIVDVKDCKKM